MKMSTMYFKFLIINKSSMTDQNNDTSACSIDSHEEMMKTNPERFRRHLQEVHDSNDPHQHDLSGIV